jgi:hypothetical protein
MPPRARRLGTEFESLEARTLPSTFGVPWADPGHLTLSFTPDGTSTPIGPSSLSATLNKTAIPAAWQREILRAFQTWAVHGNINVGLVADGGQALGTAGAVQGDTRFGDFRIAAAALSPGLVASASPFNWTGTTFAGDVLFNSSQPFRLGSGGSGFDVFTVALHEAGHAFGLDHDEHGADTVMNAGYVFSPALSTDEITDLQAMYGVRTADAFEGRTNNNTLARSSVLAGRPISSGTRFLADGDLATMSDVDCFKFTASAGTTTVRLQAKGLSLLLGKVTVYDSAGRPVAAGFTGDVFNNNVALQLSTKAGASYTVKVERTTSDVFGVGAYRLLVDTGFSGATLPAPPGWTPPTVDGHTNDTVGRATTLARSSALGWETRFDAAYRGVIEDGTDADFYRVSAPQSTTGAVSDMNVMVWSPDGSLNPRVRVYDAAGNAVAFRVLANDAGVMSVWVPNAAPGAQYVVQVAAKNPGGANGTGAYVLGVDFNTTVPPEVQEVGSGTLGLAASTETGSLTVGSGGIYQFALSAELLAAGVGAAALTVTDAAGKVVFFLDATAGGPAVTATQYLGTGTYTFHYTYRSPAGGTAAPVRYHLAFLKLSEGVGTYPTTTSTTTYTTTTKPTTYTTTSTATYTDSSKPLAPSYWYFF